MTSARVARTRRSAALRRPHPERARRDAETLLLHLIGKNKAWLMAHADEDFAGCTAIGYASLLERRRKASPSNTSPARCEFYGLPFRVTPDVLIPRPETEHLVEKVVELSQHILQHPRILDVGTGSGAIAVALAHHLPARASSPRPISSPQPPSAFARGERHPQQRRRSHPLPPRRSARACRRRAIRIHRLEPALCSQSPTAHYSPSKSANMSRHVALFGGKDGLDIYRRLIPAAHAALVPGGFLVFEFGFGQQPRSSNLCSDCRFQQHRIHPRPAGHSPRRSCAKNLDATR